MRSTQRDPDGLPSQAYACRLGWILLAGFICLKGNMATETFLKSWPAWGYRSIQAWGVRILELGSIHQLVLLLQDLWPLCTHMHHH
ncbi:hypothetical protein BJX66DRAFT_34139 [Aspergillus keveii]|uniref:Uncharacterized protein n=1 Tax=Aspergillus keveii TaxID=714993 RepID=A0ABR4GHJ8_9EURO